MFDDWKKQLAQAYWKSIENAQSSDQTVENRIRIDKRAQQAIIIHF